MSGVKQIGKLLDARGKVEMEWKITNFFSFTRADSSYISPDFHAAESRWYLEVRPNGNAKNNSSGYISIFVWRHDFDSPKNIDFEVGIKAVDGDVQYKLQTSWTFDKGCGGYGWHQFFERSKLEQQKSELVPRSILTLTCTMKERDNAPYINTRLDGLSVDLKDIFISKRNSDVTMKVKDEMFSVHKAILAARSPVFASMFENNISEKNTGVINIADCDPKAFNDFLLYVYSGKVENIAKCHIFHLYEIAHKYDMQELKSICVNFMMHNLSVENICNAVVLGHNFDETELMTKVQHFFNENFSKIVSGDNWKSLLRKDCNLANQLLIAMAPKVKIEK